jgi:cyclopropane-fatty-acyl-phospholipid synthase
MFEHVGPRNYEAYFDLVRRSLSEQGLFVLHTIGRGNASTGVDPWIEKYIFPNAVLPSMAQIIDACERDFVVEDWHNFGADYDRTLLAWHQRFEAAWPRLQRKHDERFRRMWRYYLLSCAGSFRARVNQLWQVVMSPLGVQGGYRSAR